jgi:hypothetical protein
MADWIIYSLVAIFSLEMGFFDGKSSKIEMLQIFSEHFMNESDRSIFEKPR